jgi:hypothetical protein
LFSHETKTIGCKTPIKIIDTIFLNYPCFNKTTFQCFFKLVGASILSPKKKNTNCQNVLYEEISTSFPTSTTVWDISRIDTLWRQRWQ